MATISGGEWAIRSLAGTGVQVAFGLHGAHIDTLFQGCRTNNIRLIDVRHESAAGFAAEAYARVTRKLGLALVTAGPGFTNVITSIANACEDRTPVLYLAGSARLVEAETNALQAGIDQVAIARPITKWAHRVLVPTQIGRMVAQAARIALTPPCGPVLLDIPFDVLTAQLDESELTAPAPVQLSAQMAAENGDLERASALLAAAQRPVIMVGHGAYMAHADAELLRLAETLAAPVFVDTIGHGLFPSDHRLYAASLYKMAELSEAGQRPDVILALGMRFGLTSATTSDAIVPHAARIIHIDLDARELGRTRRTELAMLADPRLAAAALAGLLADRGITARRDWTTYVLQRVAARRERQLANARLLPQGIHPLLAAEAVLAALPRETVIVSDGAETHHWLDEVLHQSEPGSFLTHGFFGCMGIGLGMALGAKAALPTRPVVCITGDGSLGFTIAEFDTLSRHELPVIVVVFNNHVWGSSTHFQLRTEGANGVIGTRLGAARYDEVASALGGHGITVTTLAEIAPAIRQGLGSDRPTCININVEFTAAPPNFQVFGKR